MRYGNVLTTAGALAAMAVNSVSAIATVTATGSKFFDSDGNQFYVKGLPPTVLCAVPLIANTDVHVQGSPTN